MGEYSTSRLDSVFVVHRHSLRAPVYYPPSHPELNASFYPRGGGYLTRKGINACFQVAKIWSSWYPNHINGKDVSTVFVRSSESPRCHETAQALLAALFTTSDEGFSPVPVYGPPPGYDKYVSLEGYNKDVNAEMRKHYQDPVEHSDALEGKTFGELLEYSKSAFGHPEAGEYDAFTYLDGVISNIYERLPIPKIWTDNEIALRKVFYKCYQHVVEQYRPFYGGHLLQGMARRMKQVFNDELRTGGRWCDYSFHDFNVSAVLHALEGEVIQPKPDFLGAIFFELRTSNDGNQFVEVYYSSGLKSDFIYSPREPMRMRWNDASHRVAFGKLYEKMFNNPYMDEVSKASASKYIGDDAMV